MSDIDTDTAPEAAGPGVTVVVPALNEERAIVQTVEAIQKAFEGHHRELEIIVVDDGSTDRTGDLAEEAGARVLRHAAPGGYGMGLRTGIRAAANETIAITDADGTYPIEELPRLVEMSERFDLVVGARTGPHYRKRALFSPLRTAFLLLANFVTGTWIPDPNSGLRVFHRREVIPMLPRLPRAFSFTTTQTVIMTLAGKWIHFEPIAYHQRIGRSKVRVLRDALRVGQTMLEVMLAYNPVKMFLVAAAPTALAALAATVWSFLDGAAVIPAVLLWCTSAIIFAAGMVSVVILDPRRLR